MATCDVPRFIRSTISSATGGSPRSSTRNCRSQQVVQATEIANLDVITCGPDVSNPADSSLASPRAIPREMRPVYDIIIIDAPPLLIVTDPWIISAVADGIILVVKVGDVRRQALEQTMEVLKTLGTPALGVVINGITRDQFGFDNRFNTLYGYGYGMATATAIVRTKFSPPPLPPTRGDAGDGSGKKQMARVFKTGPIINSESTT